MPKIRLLQKRGEYNCVFGYFKANKTYKVENQVAEYLIVRNKVAEEIEEEFIPEKEIPKIEIIKEITPEKTIPEIKIPLPNLKPIQNNSEEINNSHDKLKIALVRLGGVGDTLELAAIAIAVKRKHPESKITLYIRDKKNLDLLKCHPAIDNIKTVGDKNWSLLTIFMVKSEEYDIIYDNRYVTKVYYKDENKWKKDKKITESRYQKFRIFYDMFPFKSNTIAQETKMSLRNLSLYTANLKGYDKDLLISLENSDYNMLPILNNKKYVTVHNGADIRRQTKCWDVKLWAEVVKELEKRNYLVVQLGIKYDDTIEGVIDFTGRTTLKQCAALISKAQFHMDSESGLVHIAQAVGVKSVVLFGPTPVSFFGYDNNINIVSPIKCKECWWSTDMWWRECPKNSPLPAKCMTSITPKMVMKGIGKII